MWRPSPGVIYNHRYVLALIILLPAVSMVISAALLHGKGEGMIRGSVESNVGLPWNVFGKPGSYEPKAVILVAVLASEGDVLEPMVTLCRSGSWPVSIYVRELPRGVEGGGTYYFYTSSIRGPRIRFPHTGIYFVNINITVPENLATNCTIDLKFSFMESTFKGDVLKRCIAAAALSAGLALLPLVLRGGWGPLGWSLGLSAAPLTWFVLSLLYFAIVDPFRSRLVAVQVLGPPEVGLQLFAHEDLVFPMYNGVLRRLGPVGSPTYMMVWAFVAMVLVLLVWATPVESRVELYEAVAMLDRRKLFMYKSLTALALTLVPVVSEAVFIAAVYPGLYATYPREAFTTLLANALVLLILGGLIQSLTTLLLLVVRRGVLVAMVAGLSIMLYYSEALPVGIGYQPRILPLRISYIAEWGLGVPGMQRPGDVLGILGLTAVALAAYVASYLVYRLREVV